MRKARLNAIIFYHVHTRRRYKETEDKFVAVISISSIDYIYSSRARISSVHSTERSRSKGQLLSKNVQYKDKILEITLQNLKY